MLNAFVAGTGAFLPPRVVTNHELITDFGVDTTDDWIQQRTGIRERRFVEEGVGTSDLALEASRVAIAKAGLEAAEIDLIVYATLSPEWAFPGGGVLLQEKLGLPQAGRFVPALDVRDQCSGFLYGLGTATAMVRSGAARNVLVVGTEIHSTGLDLSARGRAVASLFGDGAGAVVIAATEADRGVRTWRLGADGRYADVLTQRIWDIRKRPFIHRNSEGLGVVPPEDMYAQMNGRLVFRHAVTRLQEALEGVCGEEGMAPKDLDRVYFHQANLRINQHVAERLGLDPARVPSNIERYGNTTAATLPILLAEEEAAGRLERGMRVGLAAFGSGFTWGAAIVDW
ncbi:MAG: ketoacyl-ACP synthase III [Deltaproteobacteria bacterium]|nr:ketoacyl-ACP synthase III [Deltaproteobacteria bacterium]